MKCPNCGFEETIVHEAHLSFDIDFYTEKKIEDPLVLNALITSLYNIQEAGVPVIVKTHHHHILKYINQFEFKKIINVDAHSDIVNEDCGFDLDCGSWANFYKHKKNAVFEWIHPHSEAKWFNLGRCDYYNWTDWNKEKVKFGYKDAIHRKRSDVISLVIPKDVHSISVVVSPDYWSYNNNQYMKTLKKLFPWLRNNHRLNFGKLDE